jgi:hypothetical protein
LLFPVKVQDEKKLLEKIEKIEKTGEEGIVGEDRRRN